MRSRAFTLVEVLVTTILAALLMLAVLQVLSGMPRAQAEMDRKEASHPVPERVVALIRQDLQNARSITMAGADFKVIVLQGFGALDPETNRLTHLPARVFYSVKTDGSQSWLIRSQQLLAGDGPRSVTDDLVCPDVTAMTLRRLPDPAANNPDPGTLTGDIPGALLLTLRLKSSLVFETTVIVR